MAEPTANYYVFQYLDTHEQRYNAMFNLALQEVQSDYTARMTQQEFLASENKKLQSYVQALEKDLTDYISQKGKSAEVDADKELALMRMYIDLEKAKASQQSSAQSRRLDAERLARSQYEVSTGMSKAIVDADNDVGSRASLATSEAALTGLIKEEVGKIIVPERGTGNALAAAQQLQAKLQDTATRKGVGALYNEAEVKQFISDHYGLNNYKPKSDEKAPNPQAGITNPFDYNIPALETYDVDLAKRQQYAATGGLGRRSSDVDKQLQELRKGKTTTTKVQTAAETLRMHEDYGMLIRAISDDGQVSQDEFDLFTARMDNGVPEVAALYGAIKAGAREGNVDLDKLKLEDQLIYDDQFIRKLGSLDTAGARQKEIQTELKKAVAAPTYEDVTERARELYDPIRMTGSPSYTRYTLQDPATGESFEATGRDIMEMQQEFEQVLRDNPQVAANYRSIEAAYAIAKDVKPPQAASSKTSPQYLGYQLYKEFEKLGSTPEAAERISNLAGQLAGNSQETEDILKYFHAYNIQANDNNFAPHDSTPAEDALFQQLRKEQQQQQEALQNMRGEIEQEMEDKRSKLKTDDMLSFKERKAIQEQIKDLETTQSDDDILLQRIATATAPVKDATQKTPGVIMDAAALEAEMNQPLAPIRVPINQPLMNKQTYNYAVKSYDEAGQPTFIETVQGKPMNQAMIDEAMIAYNEELKRLQLQSGE